MLVLKIKFTLFMGMYACLYLVILIHEVHSEN